MDSMPYAYTWISQTISVYSRMYVQYYTGPAGLPGTNGPQRHLRSIRHAGNHILFIQDQASRRWIG
jgi:hypothetical protein